jgi:hypothetical protein
MRPGGGAGKNNKLRITINDGERDERTKTT